MVAALPVDINLPATTLSLLSLGTADTCFHHGLLWLGWPRCLLSKHWLLVLNSKNNKHRGSVLQPCIKRSQQRFSLTEAFTILWAGECHKLVRRTNGFNRCKLVQEVPPSEKIMLPFS